MNIDLASPFAAALSLSLLGFTGVINAVGVMQRPIITGTASYDAPVFPGETVMLKWRFHKRSECIGENSRHWEGADGFALTEAAKQNSLAVTPEPIEPIIPTEIPRYAPGGTLRLWIVGTCQLPNGRGHEEFRLGPVVFTVDDSGA